MISVDQIREQIQQVIEGNITLDDFDEWFAGASWNMQKSSAREAVSLAGKVELYLAEFDEGHLSEAALLARLKDLVPAFAATS